MHDHSKLDLHTKAKTIQKSSLTIGKKIRKQKKPQRVRTIVINEIKQRLSLCTQSHNDDSAKYSAKKN